MGQKVNPHGLRVGVIKDWDSRWYAREEKVGDLIVEDYKIREYLKKALYSAGVPTIEIERDSAKVRIYIHCARPGVVIGKGGQEIERLRGEVQKLIGKPVALSIVEVRTPDTNAQLVAESIAQVGYITPIVIDENNLILAGETRLKALKKRGVKRDKVLQVVGLTEEQKKKYRLLDNKVGEIAEWDTELLAAELAAVDFGAFDFGFDDLAAALASGRGTSGMRFS